MNSNADLQGLEVCRSHVLPEWIDINGHMNVAYYVLAFDQAVDTLWDDFGITADHIRDANSSTFAVESHITYSRELKVGEPYIVTAQILAFSAKGIHQLQRMYHAEKKFLAATGEWINLHVDLATRRVTPWPANVLERIRAFAVTQGDVAPAAEVGRVMQLNNPLFSTRGARQ